MSHTLAPRNVRPIASLLERDLATHLREHPDAFDCLLYRALPGSEETVAVAPDVVGSLESGERRLEYAPPIRCRGMIIPDEATAFGMVDAGLRESFDDASQALILLLSETAPKHSFLLWREYIEAHSDAVADRVVYVRDAEAVGRNLNAGSLLTCLPLSAAGEFPETEDRALPEKNTETAAAGAEPEKSGAGVL